MENEPSALPQLPHYDENRPEYQNAPEYMKPLLLRAFNIMNDLLESLSELGSEATAFIGGMTEKIISGELTTEQANGKLNDIMQKIEIAKSKGISLDGVVQKIAASGSEEDIPNLSAFLETIENMDELDELDKDQ